MKIADIQRFCMHDGPGIRTTVFLKGCPLHCAWCHNIETQNSKPEILFYKNRCINCKKCFSCEYGAHSFENEHILNHDLCISCGECVSLCPCNALELIGKDYTPEELLEIVMKDKAFYGKSGGVTLSGGEPLFQKETIEFLKLCKENGIHTAIETCGFVSEDTIKKAIPYVDLFLWDIKDTNSKRHKEFTGVENEKIISNLMLADSFGAKTIIRCILINNVNAEIKHYKDVQKIILNLKNNLGAEVLPYHTYGSSKAEALGKFNTANTDWIPKEKQILEFKSVLREKGIKIY